MRRPEDLPDRAIDPLNPQGSDSLVKKQPDGSAVVLGRAPIRDVNRALGLELEEREDYTTMAGPFISLAGGIPAKGSTLTTPDGTRLEVLDASSHQVRLIRMTLSKAASL